MIRIVESKFLTSAVNTRGYPETVFPEFAFVGRSNVGKSSMINTVTNRKILAKVANTPGKTRLINFFEIRYLKSDEPTPKSDEQGNLEAVDSTVISNRNGFFSLVDLPGYGYAKVSKTMRDDWKKMISEFFRYRQQLSGAVVLVDIRHEPDPKDIGMVQMLEELKINFILVATKCDKISKSSIPAALKAFKQAFGVKTGHVFEFSSHKKIGVPKVLSWIENTINETETKSRVIIHS